MYFETFNINVLLKLQGLCAAYSFAYFYFSLFS